MFNKNSSTDWGNAMKAFSIGMSWIAGPIILALIIGNWLDEKQGKEYFFTLTFVGIAFIITCVGIVREALKATKDLKD